MPVEMTDDPYRPGERVRLSLADVAPHNRFATAVDRAQQAQAEDRQQAVERRQADRTQAAEAMAQ